MLTEEEVRKIAQLARVRLTDEQVKKFSSQLTNVLEYVEILGEVDTEGVAETSQVTGLSNVMDEDCVLESEASREELLGCSELPVDSKQVRVMKTI